MKNTTPPENRAAATVKDQLTDAAANFRFQHRMPIDTSDFLNNPEQTEVIAISHNGRRNEALCPCYPRMSLKMNLALAYTCIMRDGYAVSGLRTGKLNRSGQRAWIFTTSEDPAEHRSMGELWRAAS